MEKIAEQIWGCETDVRMPGGISMRTRMTVLDLGDGELLLHSPIALDDECRKTLANIGEVRWIVAPNDFHNLFVEAAAAEFPDASVLAGQGVRAKRPGLRVDHALELGAPEQWGGRLRAVTVGGSRLWHEHVFVHPESGTLLCADFVFNIQQIPNLMTGFVLWMVGTNRRFAQSRSVRHFFVKDRDAFTRSVNELMAMPFDRVVMCHGEVVASGGRELVSGALAWARGGASGELPA